MTLNEGAPTCNINFILVNLYIFREEKKIEFRDVNDFNKILRSHSVAPHKPTQLDRNAASTLIYSDESTKNIDVHWLDFTGSNPKPPAGKVVIGTELHFIDDICFVQYGDKQLLAVAARKAGLFVYNIRKDKLEWKVDGKVCGMERALRANGVTTDGRGNLFVADRGNECIQMFSASDGQYLGRLMKGVETIGGPFSVQWSAETSSLVAACYLNAEWHLQVINIQY